MSYDGLLANKVVLPLTFAFGMAGGLWAAKKIPEYVNSTTDKLAKNTAQQIVTQLQQTAYQTAEQQQMYSILNELKGLPDRIGRLEKQIENYAKKD